MNTVCVLVLVGNKTSQHVARSAMGHLVSQQMDDIFPKTTEDREMPAP